MLPETTKPTQSFSQGDQPKQLDREVRDMVNAITGRVADADEDEHGMRIITLAGNNTGSIMKTELDDKANDPHGISAGEPEALATYVNSNFQAVNNSIMLGSSYNTNDPGVHVEIEDTLQHHHGHKPHYKLEKKFGKKKEKETLKSDKDAEHND